MSDVVINVVESATNVNVTEQDVAVDVTETVVEVSASTAGLQGASYEPGDPIYVTVRNATGATLPKGTIVYTSGAQGNHTLVQKALATGDVTSARTLGWVSADIPNNADGLVMVEGYLDGIDTDHIAEGSQLYLSGTVAGGFTATKPQAPIHLVYVGVVTKSNPGNGRVLVKVQNGYEISELHDVKITSPANNDVLTYDSATDLWINKVNAADGVTSITAASPLTGGTITSTGTIGLDQTALSITRSQVTDFTSGTVSSAATAQQAGTAVYAVNSGTAIYATNAGTAVYSVTSGTAVSISGSIAQSQVTNLVTDLSGKANLAGGNAFTGNQTIVADSATDRPVIIKGFSGQTANLLEARSSADVLLTRIDRNGAVSATYWGPVGTGLTGYLEWITSTPTFYSGAAATTGMIIKGAASQTASMLQLQNSAGNITANFTAPVNNVNRLNLGGTDLSATFGITVHASGGVGQVIRAAASQSANIQEWQDSAGTILTRISPVGQVVSNSQAFFGSGAASIPNTRLNVATGSSSVVGQVIRGASGQTADLLQIQDNAGTSYLSVNNVGSLLFGTGSGSFLSGANGRVNVQLSGDNIGVTVRAFGSQTADLLQFQTNTGSYAGGFERAGALNIQPAAALNGYSLMARAASASVVPVMVRGAASQTADLLQLQTSAGSIVADFSADGALFINNQTTVSDSLLVQRGGGTHLRVDPFNNTFVGGSLTVGANSTGGSIQAGIYSSAATNKGLIVRGAASQSANYFEIQNSASNTQMYIDANLNIRAIGAISMGNLALGSGLISGQTTSASQVGILIKGATSQTADLLQVENVGGTDLFAISSAGQITAKVVGNAANQSRGIMLSNTSDLWQSGLYLKSDAGGNPRLTLLAPTGALGEAISIDSGNKVGINFIDPPAQLSIQPTLTTRVGQIIRGVASQTANAVEIQTSDGVANTSMTVYGGITSRLSGSYPGVWSVGTGTTSTIGLVVRGVASQTADLQQWQNSAGGVSGKFDAYGYFTANGGYVLASSGGSLERAFGGAFLGMAKTTSTVTNPGANIARMYLVDGTVPGTLKLVVRAGAAGAETTILDNIPQ